MPDYLTPFNASLAQSAERHFRKMEVVSANLTGSSTIYWHMHDHILRRLTESEDGDPRERLRKIIKELRELTDIQGVGTVARDLDDILNVPVAE